MNSENLDAELIFGEALRLKTPAERAACLDQACGGNQAFRQQIESLLTAYSHAGGFLNQTRSVQASELLIERTGAMIGLYKPLEKIGEGGFGMVYMAEQEEPVRRRVALKIIKLGMATREVRDHDCGGVVARGRERDVQCQRTAGPCVRSGFTLIEFLVVIATISVLAAVLLPALSVARQESQLTACKSNLRQLGVALRMYLDDSDGVYPYAASLHAANPRGISFWFDALDTEIPSGKWGDGVFKCVAYRGNVYEGGTAVNNRGQLTAVYAPCGSYAYNVVGRGDLVPGSIWSSRRGLGFSMNAGQPIGPPIRENDVKAPADLYVFGDAPLATGVWGTGGTISLGGAADYNSFAAENAAVKIATHFSVFNMLLADTHIEGVRTSVLLGTNAVHIRRWNRDNLP